MLEVSVSDRIALFLTCYRTQVHSKPNKCVREVGDERSFREGTNITNELCKVAELSGLVCS